VLVAVTALVMGSFGTAAAAGLTITQVKQIASRVVNRKAPHLSVASATTANNAKSLGGQGPAVYRDRAVASFDTSGVGGGVPIPPGVNNATELRPAVTLTIPSGIHAAHVTAAASFVTGTQGDVNLWYAVDTPCSTLSGSGFDHRVVLTAIPDISMGVLDVLQSLTGTHTFRLCAYADFQSGAFNSYITV
jgi:hypothetical protein